MPAALRGRASTMQTSKEEAAIRAAAAFALSTDVAAHASAHDYAREFDQRFAAWSEACVLAHSQLRARHGEQETRLSASFVIAEREAARGCQEAVQLRQQQAAHLAARQYEASFEALTRLERAEQRAARAHRVAQEEPNEHQLADLRRAQRVEREELQALCEETEQELLFTRARRLFQLGGAPPEQPQPGTEPAAPPPAYQYEHRPHQYEYPGVAVHWPEYADWPQPACHHSSAEAMGAAQECLPPQYYAEQYHAEQQYAEQYYADAEQYYAEQHYAEQPLGWAAPVHWPLAPIPAGWGRTAPAEQPHAVTGGGGDVDAVAKLLATLLGGLHSQQFAAHTREAVAPHAPASNSAHPEPSPPPPPPSPPQVQQRAPPTSLYIAAPAPPRPARLDAQPPPQPSAQPPPDECELSDDSSDASGASETSSLDSAFAPAATQRAEEAPTAGRLALAVLAPAPNGVAAVAAVPLALPAPDAGDAKPQFSLGALIAARRASETLARAAAATRREFTTTDFRQLFSFCRHGKYLQAKELLRGGCPVDGRDQFGNTPLIIACQNGHARLAKVLLRHGAAVAAANRSGNTGLHYAVSFGFAPLADFLISQGADDSVRNAAGLTPYEGIK